MRGKLSLCILALTLVSPGCAVISEGVHVISHEWGLEIDDCLERSRNRKWAEQAWANCPVSWQPCSEDFALGFKDGFAEYLYRGGDCEPPLVPPTRFRKFRYQTPQGYQAIEEWFA